MTLYYFNPRTGHSTYVTRENYLYLSTSSLSFSYTGACDDNGNLYLIISTEQGKLELRSDQPITKPDDFFDKAKALGIDLHFMTFNF